MPAQHLIALGPTFTLSCSVNAWVGDDQMLVPLINPDAIPMQNHFDRITDMTFHQLHTRFCLIRRE